jgi:lysophospholipase L1-like esterase
MSSLVACASSPKNSAVKVQQAAKASMTYVAIGASDTFGTGTDNPESESWPSDLTRLLGNQARLVNLGIPGIDVHDALRVELPVALDAHPDLVTVWLAVNDLADQVPIASYAQDLDALIQRLQTSCPHAHIAVANVPDLTLLPRFQTYNIQQLHTQIANYNTSIASIANKYNIILVDLYQTWRELANHPEYISSDGFHPNKLGYLRVAQIFYQALHQNGIS